MRHSTSNLPAREINNNLLRDLRLCVLCFRGLSHHLNDGLNWERDGLRQIPSLSEFVHAKNYFGSI